MSGQKNQDEIEGLANWYDTNSAAETETGEWLEGEVADEPMSVRSIRLPVETSQRVARIAEARGLRQSELMRHWIEQGLVAEESGSGSDAVRATIAEALQAVAEVGRKSGVIVSVEFASTKTAARKSTAKKLVAKKTATSKRAASAERSAG